MNYEQLLKSFYDYFVFEVNDLKNLGLISEEALVKYQEYNIHSILQYCAIKAGLLANLIPIPEYKIRLIKPIDKYEVDKRYKEQAKNQKKIGARYQHKVTVDIALIKDNRVRGFCEIYTPDEIHGVLLSRELSEPWITPRHKLQHLVKCMSFDFCILINLFTTLPSWRDAKKYSLDEWRKLWKSFAIDLSRDVSVMHIMINSINDINYMYYKRH